MSDEVASACGGCGATVYQEHIDSGIARYEGDRLLCKHCLEEKDQATGGAEDFEPIRFEDEDAPAVDMTESRIQTTTEDSLVTAAVRDESHFKRPLDPKGQGATRVRIFHSKLTEGALDYLNNQVNEWIDDRDDVVVKFAVTTIGMFEGKHSELHMFLTVFY